MKPYHVNCCTSTETFELDSYNNLEDAINCVIGGLPSDAQLYDSNYTEHWCAWEVVEYIYDEDGEIIDEKQHYVSETYFEEEYFRKKFGNPDFVDTMAELAEYIKKYGNNKCVDYIIEKNGWKDEIDYITDGTDIVTRHEGLLNPSYKDFDYFAARNFLPKRSDSRTSLAHALVNRVFNGEGTENLPILKTLKDDEDRMALAEDLIGVHNYTEFYPENFKNTEEYDGIDAHVDAARLEFVRNLNGEYAEEDELKELFK